MLLWEEASSAGLSRFHCILVTFFLFDLDLFAQPNIVLFPSSEQD